MVVDTISSLFPQAKVRLASKVWRRAFSGDASAEFRLNDATTGELLAAGIDRWGGTKSLSEVTDSWRDVTESYRFWVE